MRGLVLCAALTAAAPILAQDRMAVDTCVASWDRALQFAGVPAQDLAITANDEGWCQIENETVQTNSRTSVTVDAVRWRASDMGRFLDAGLPPRALDLEIVGLSSRPVTGDPVLDYLLGLQAGAASVSLGLSARWDGVQNAVFVDDAYIVFDDSNRVEVTAQIANVNLTDRTSMQSSLGAAGLRDLTLKSDLNGWFETFAALPLGMMLLAPDGAAPAAQVAQLLQRVTGWMDALPDTVMPAVSKAAATDFVAALPEPRGVLQLQVSADPVIGAARAMPLMMLGDTATAAERAEVALTGVSLLVTWTPTGDPE